MPNRFEYSQSAFALLEQINRQFAMNEPRTFEDLFFAYCFDEYVERIVDILTVLYVNMLGSTIA